MDVDPIASMQCWAITFELGGREFDIPALPAVDWWPVLVSSDPTKVLDLLKSDVSGAAELDDMLLDGRVTGEDLGTALTDALQEVTGRSMHVAFVLATAADMQWGVIGGHLALKGFRWDVLPIGAALDAIYSTLLAGMNEENTKKFLALLENETLSQPGKKRTPSERVTAEFETMAGPRPAPAPLPGIASAEPSVRQRTRTRIRPRQPHQVGRSAGPTSQP